MVRLLFDWGANRGVEPNQESEDLKKCEKAAVLIFERPRPQDQRLSLNAARVFA